MATEKLEITGDTNVAQREIDKLTKNVAKLREEVRRTAEQSKKSGKETTGAFSDGADKIGDMVSGLFSVQAGVGIVTQAYKDWRMEINQLGEAHKKLTVDILKSQITTGAAGPELETFLKNIRGATKEQGIKAFGAVASAGGDMSMSRKLELAERLAQLSPAGINLEQSGAIAGDLGELFGDKSADDITDLTLKAQRMAGDKASQLGSDGFMRAMRGMTAAGMSPEESLGRALGALDSDQALKQFTALGAALTAETGTYGQDKKDSRAEKAFDKATPEQRMRMLESDPTLARKVLGSTGGFNLRQQEKADLDRRMAELSGAQEGDYAKQQLQQLSTFDTGRLALDQQRAAVEADKVNAEVAEREAKQDVILQEGRTAAAKKFGPIGRAVGNQVIQQDDYLVAPLKGGNLGADVGMWLARLVGLMEENNKLTRDGKPRNIDAHTE